MTITMEIKKLDNFGRGITYLNDKIVFVNGALPDEDVEIDIIKEDKKFYEANVKSINKPSLKRIQPKCPYYNVCGGCNMMHLNLDNQEEFKISKVEDIIKKYGLIDKNIKLVKNDKELYYRNKITLKVKDYAWGYYNSNTHNFVEVNNCLLANNAINDIISNKYILFNNGEIVIRSNYDNQILISITTEDTNYVVKDNLPENIVGIVINDKTLFGNNFFFDYIGDYKFKVSYNSFFQVNNYIASKIFELLNNNLEGENLLDLYCGVGTLGISLKDKFKYIYGIEKISNAIKDANDNAIMNGVTNAKYIVGNTSDIVNDINVEFDTVVVDPPRSGLNKETLNYLVKTLPKSIAYVSCDPMTLARDLKALHEYYKILKIYAFDMFPNTYHVESVCILERK